MFGFSWLYCPFSMALVLPNGYTVPFQWHWCCQTVILSLFNGIGAAIRLSPNTQPNFSEVGPIALMADVIRVGDV
jgi:hypothetical protein